VLYGEQEFFFLLTTDSSIHHLRRGVRLRAGDTAATNEPVSQNCLMPAPAPFSRAPCCGAEGWKTLVFSSIQPLELTADPPVVDYFASKGATTRLGRFDVDVDAKTDVKELPRIEEEGWWCQPPKA